MSKGLVWGRVIAFGVFNSKKINRINPPPASELRLIKFQTKSQASQKKT